MVLNLRSFLESNLQPWFVLGWAPSSCSLWLWSWSLIRWLPSGWFSPSSPLKRVSSASCTSGASTWTWFQWSGTCLLKQFPYHLFNASKVALKSVRCTYDESNWKPEHSLKMNYDYQLLFNHNLNLYQHFTSLIMCIGFSVDFSAHISYHFLASKEGSPDDRIRSSLKAFGTPIIQVRWFCETECNLNRGCHWQGSKWRASNNS